MIKKRTFRTATLALTLLSIFATCGWIPFTAPVTINTTPEGAAVYKIDSTEPIGTTPFKTRVFHFDREYEIRMDGFFSEPITLDYNSPEEVYIKLKPLPVLLYTKPEAEVYAAGAEQPLGETPLKVDVYHEDRTYVLKAKDYYDKEITIGLSTEDPMVIALDRRPIITLNTSPENVEIYEKGKLVATSSMTEEILMKRTFELRKEGYFTKTIELTSSSPYTINETLVPLPVIDIRSTPTDADVYLVGETQSLGKTPLKVTVEKAASFEVRADRYYKETFTVEPKSSLVEAMLDPMPYVTITSDPSGAEIYLDGKKIGTTPLEQLIEKETTYEIRQEGYLPQTITLDGKTSQPLISLEAEPVIVETNEVAAVTNEPIEIIEETTVEPKSMNLPILIGIAVAIVAAAGILIGVLKKKKA